MLTADMNLKTVSTSTRSLTAGSKGSQLLCLGPVSVLQCQCCSATANLCKVCNALRLCDCLCHPAVHVRVLLRCFTTAGQRQIADGETPLFVASQNGIVEAVDALLGTGEAATVNPGAVNQARASVA